MLGSLVCEEVGPIFLGPKLVTLKKEREESGKQEEEKKQRDEKREEKRICPYFINKSIPLHLWSDRVEIWRRGLKLE